MTEVASRRRFCSIALLTIAMIGVSHIAPDARADPIAYVTVTGAVVEITGVADPQAHGTPAHVLLTGSDGFRLITDGITTGAPCPSGCAPGETIAFGGELYMESGTVSFGGATAPFGSGDLNFTGDDFFTLPPGSTTPLVVRRFILLQHGAIFAPGLLPPTFELIPASGFATGTFAFGPTETGASAWHFQHVRIDIGEPVPEPGSMLLLAAGLGVLSIVRRRRQSVV